MDWDTFWATFPQTNLVTLAVMSNCMLQTEKMSKNSENVEFI
jgi:hypothetical protein